MKVLNCELIEKKLIFYIDDELDVNESVLVKAHLDTCPKCQFLFNQLNESMILIEMDKVPGINPFFHTRVMEKIKTPADNRPAPAWMPKRQMVLQYAFYMALGVFALFAGLYLGSGTNTMDETSLSEQTDTTDSQLFADTYNFNFNQNVYLVELKTNGE